MSTDKAISTILLNLEQQGGCAWRLLVGHSSAFNTIIPSKLVSRMISLGLNSNICLWMKDLLMDWPRTFRAGQSAQEPHRGLC